MRVSSGAAAELHVILEAIGVYHEAVATFLHNTGCCVSVVNPCKPNGLPKAWASGQRPTGTTA